MLTCRQQQPAGLSGRSVTRPPLLAWRPRLQLDHVGPALAVPAPAIQARGTRRPLLCAAAAAAAPPGGGGRSSKLRRSIWTAVDVAALLGSVAGALAALLGVVSPTYALTLPLVLPVVSLVAALQREDLSNEEGAAALSELRSSMARDSGALLRDAAAAVEEVRREVRGQSGAAGRLAALEDKLTVLEGAVVGAARNSREAVAAVNALGSALAQGGQLGPGGPANQASAQLLAGMVAGELALLLRAELAGAVGGWQAEAGAALRRLDTRMAVVEGSVAGLEAAQGEGLMALGSSLHSGLADAQSALQSTVCVEVAAAVEPLKQLPQLVAAAATRAAAAAMQQQQQLAGAASEGGAAGEAAAAGASVGPPLDQQLLLQQLQEAVASEVAAATQQLLAQQADVLVSLAAPPRPVSLADEQWEALGRRLARLERLVQDLPELGEQAVAGQLAPLVAAQQAAADAQQAVLAQLGDGPQQQQQQQLADVAAALVSVQARLEQVAAQLQGKPGSAAGAEQLLVQLQDIVQQLNEQHTQQQQQPVFAAEDVLVSCQQQVQQVAALLQQVQQDLPLQLAQALQQSGMQAAPADRAVDAFDGSGFNDAGGGSAAAAAAAATAAAAAASGAAQGIAEVRQLLGGVQAAAADLQVQVGTLAAQVAAQQAAILSSSSSSSQAGNDVLEAVQQQLLDSSSQLSAGLSQQLAGLAGQLQAQLLELQQQLVDAATAAASQAAADAAAAAAAAAASQALQQQQLPPDAAAAGVTQPLLQGAALDGSSSSSLTGSPVGAGAYVDAASSSWGSELQQQPEWQAAAAAAAAGGGSPPGAAGPAAWEQAAALPPASWQQLPDGSQPQQPQWPPAAAPAPPAAAPPAAAPAPPPLQLPDVSALSAEQLRGEGLRLLRSGRDATRGSGSYGASGPAYGDAEALLAAAVACLGAAVAGAPSDSRALGNLGNALLAQGELKGELLRELRLAAATGGVAAGGDGSLQAAEVRLRAEASGLLTRAGETFRRVLEVDGWSSRALVNWGKAMVGRAELAADRSAAAKLYSAAIDKFEAVLEEDPGMVVAKYRCALAMRGLASLGPPLPGSAGGGASGGGRQVLVLLSDAAAYLGDVLAAGGGGDEGLVEAAAAALAGVQQELAAARAAA